MLGFSETSLKHFLEDRSHGSQPHLLPGTGVIDISFFRKQIFARHRIPSWSDLVGEGKALIFETKSLYVAHSDLQLTQVLPQPPECWITGVHHIQLLLAL